MSVFNIRITFLISHEVREPVQHMSMTHLRHWHLSHAG